MSATAPSHVHVQPPSTLAEESTPIPMKQWVLDRAVMYHRGIPGLKNLPVTVFATILAVLSLNIVVWVGVGIVLYFNGALASTALLAYALGLRHALDADHISAIDLTTRRLVAAGQRPTTIGLFFSLGHSTIVIITSIVVAATAAAVRDRFDKYSYIGGIIGSSISAAFLIILGIMNSLILYKLLDQMNTLLTTHPRHRSEFKITGAGCLFYVSRKLFKFIDRPWKIYPLGVLFGLGFDTSSEVALLGISSIQAAKGTSMWLILIFPILFTAGMCLLDTTDGALMMTMYTSTALARDEIAVLYYSIVLTVITIVVATLIGIMQLLSLILNIAEPKGRFWDGVATIEDYYDVIGATICASFILFGGISIFLYEPWRRHVDPKRRNLEESQSDPSAEREALLGEQEPSEGYEEGLEEDTSLQRPGTEDVEYNKNTQTR